MQTATTNKSKVNFSNYAGRAKKEFFSKEEKRKRMEANKKVLDEIWEELMEVIYQIKHTSDRSTLKILRNRERILTNKYCFSNSLDEIITND